MKKLVLPLLLLVAFGMLAAVESDPSNVVGYVKYPSYTGLNLVGYPMGTDTIAEDAIAPYMPNVSSIAIWQANLVPQGFNAINYDPDFGEWDGTHSITIGDCLNLNSGSGTVWPVRGSVVQPSRARM